MTGNGGPEYFFETQKIIYRTMEEKVYRDFVLSKDYMEYICQSESVIDELRAHLPEGEEESHTLAWSDGMNIREKVSINVCFEINLIFKLKICRKTEI